MVIFDGIFREIFLYDIFHSYFFTSDSSICKNSTDLRPSQPASTYFTSRGQGRYFESHAFMQDIHDKHVSKPIKSAKVSGPMGWFVPSFMALSMDSTEAMPSWAYIYFINHRHQNAIDYEARHILWLSTKTFSNLSTKALIRPGLI